MKYFPLQCQIVCAPPHHHHIMHIIIIVQLVWPHTSHSISSFVTCLRHSLAHCIRASALFYIFLHLSYIWRARHNHWPNREKSDWNNKNNNSSIEMKNGSRFYVPFVHIKCQCPSRFNPNHHHHSIKRSIDRYIDLPFTFIISIRVGDARTTDQMTKTAGWQAGRLLCDRSQSAQSQPASHRSYSRGQAVIRSKYDQAPP